MHRREQVPRRFGRKLDNEDGGEWSRRGLPKSTSKTHLRVGKVQGYLELPDQELGSCERFLMMGSNED
jgi:hypothetical protein